MGLLSTASTFIQLKSNKINVIMSPPPGGWGGGGRVGWDHIVFSADPVGVGVGGVVGVATCLHSISLLNGQILAKLTQIYHCEREKC